MDHGQELTQPRAGWLVATFLIYKDVDRALDH